MGEVILIPYRPDSVNSHWRRSANGIYISKKGKIFRENVQKYMAIIRHKKYTGKLKVCLELSFKDKKDRDIDNYCKAIFDSLNGILWEDDKQIYQLYITKKIGTGQDYFKIGVEEI